jgi:hypothetical protein
MIENTERDSGESPETQPESVEVKSKYEFVMAASKEAERLNEQNRRRGLLSAREKVTLDAIRRIRRGLSRVVYEDQTAVAEESGKESTYFFGG